MTEELAELLSTTNGQLEYRIGTNVRIHGRDTES